LLEADQLLPTALPPSVQSTLDEAPLPVDRAPLTDFADPQSLQLDVSRRP
jgi:hypothetical protein